MSCSFANVLSSVRLEFKSNRKKKYKSFQLVKKTSRDRFKPRDKAEADTLKPHPILTGITLADLAIPLLPPIAMEAAPEGDFSEVF